MMIETRPSRLLQRSRAIARALALGALVLGPLALAGAAVAQQPFDVTLYHAFDDETGTDPRPTSSAPPGCQIAGGGGTVTIDFDSLNNDDLVTDQFPGAAFSSGPGQEVRVFPSGNPYGTSEPNFICAAIIEEGPDCNGDVIVDYSPATDNVSFIVSADETEGIAGVVDVYEDGVLSETVDILTDGDAFTPHPVDLSAFSNVTRIHIFIEDPGGLSLDDFAFGVPGGIDCVIKGGLNEELNVWINGGPTASGDETICMLGEGGGSGDELCGADILFQLSGVGEFRRFQPDASMNTLVYKPDCVFDEEAEQCLLPPGTTQVRMNFLRGLSSPGTDQQRLGTLVVNSTGLGEGASTTVTAFGEAAGANLQQRPLASSGNPEVVAVSEVPEPGQLVQLVSGLFGLGFLYRLRRRS